jgi:hypothetical protein
VFKNDGATPPLTHTSSSLFLIYLMQGNFAFFSFCFYCQTTKNIAFFLYPIFNGIFAQSKYCGVTTAGPYWAAAPKQQERNGVFCLIRADGCARNNGIRLAIVKQQFHCNRGTVFYIRSVTKCYKQDQLAVAVRGQLLLSQCELLLLEAGSWQFENPDEGERPPLEAAAKQRE